MRKIITIPKERSLDYINSVLQSEDGLTSNGIKKITTNAQNINFYTAGRNWRDGNGGSPNSPLLDVYPDAAVAFSLRKLRTEYTGSAVQIRRGSDSSLMDIGFVDGNFDINALTSFVGSSSAWVQTWYDQSGNGRHAGNITPSTQPYIIYNGDLQNLDGNICVRFDDTSTSALDWLNFSVYHEANAPFLSNHFVGGTYIDGNYPYFLSTVNADRGFGLGMNESTRQLRPITVRTGGVSQYYGSVIEIANPYILTTTCDRSSLRAYINGTLDISGSDSDTDFVMPSAYRLGNQNTGAVQGVILIAEFVAYSRDVSSNINGINNAINNYYGIY